MAKVRTRGDTGLLFLDFYFRGVRCREQTILPDTAENHRKVQTLLNRIQKEIAQGLFDYAATFPNSPRAERFATPKVAAPTPTSTGTATCNTPLFEDFAEQWFLEMTPQWRNSHRAAVREVIDRKLVPCFGGRFIADITKADVLAFRVEVSQQPGRNGTLGNARINKIMCFLRQILNEASDRYDLKPAFRGVKPLKQKKADVQPFSLDEVNVLIETIRPDYRTSGSGLLK